MSLIRSTSRYFLFVGAADSRPPVSYTHLDVYKRQSQSQNIAQYFAPACKVTPAPGAQPIHGADNLSAQLGQWLSNLQIGRFVIKQQYLKVSPDRQLGRAIICVKLTLTYINQLTNYEGWYNTEWIPVQGSWLIQSVTPIDVASATKVGDTIPQIYFDPYWGPGWGYY